ncbi:MAG: DUF3078 domain-containing protein [Flavobacteriales bacterium]|nr:DUF3078 domain-containing protein [Flavobacteriales bacterium]
MRKTIALVMAMSMAFSSVDAQTLASSFERRSNNPANGPVLNAAVLNMLNTPAEDTTPDGWKFGGFTSLQINQMALVNWNAGGENAFSGVAQVALFANLKKNGWHWNNALDLGFGQMYSKSFGWQKNEDKINVLSTVTRPIGISKKFSYAAEVNFKTQFAPGYQLPNDSVAISRFMAPGYLILTVGVAYKPADWISFYLSPATGKFTFVTDPDLNARAAFGVDTGKTVNSEFGAYFRLNVKKEIMKNITIQTDVTLFNNYTDKDPVNQKKVDVDWQTSINMKVNKFITVSLFTHLIYDYDIKQLVFDGDKPVYQLDENGFFLTDADGKKLQKRDALVQFKEVLGVGFAYKF